ncbi:Phosphatidylinositol-glycan biosynthesis class F protein [Hypsizygus marmoreus]|uniref:Phosphatidylinositol-glycan biosynthesis class F protein n=1 Tax=Hypsizygus marmoreus TaxID=39966 RepID=A0A369JAB4_HYPMA|nr:Phosphatidylinositol-glycan biosynthesis class F protein [Hypsizygus marmoreus]
MKQPAVLNNSGFFPFARYTSVVGVHTTLLTFTALFLPRTTFLFEFAKPLLDPESLTSRDRPQHPFLEALTISPVSTLACLCGGAILLQGWWGGWMRDWSVDYSLEGSAEEKMVAKKNIEKKRLSALGKAWLTTFATSPVLHVVLVLFGAPLASHIVQTYLLALLISILVVFPPAYSLGPFTLANDSQSVVTRMTWVRLFAEFSIRTPIERAFVYPAIGTTLGCWLGVIPIALDWDRPWQAWPLTPTFGAISGYIIASMFALTASATNIMADEHIRSLNIDKKIT